MTHAARRTVSMCPGPVSRRSFLEVGSLGLGMLGLSDILRLKAAAAETSSRKTANDDTSIIFIWLPGGPPHMEMYDMKPDAPEEYRGLFKPVPTNVKGIDVCELMPLHTKCADRYTLVRSVAHEFLPNRRAQSECIDFFLDRSTLQDTADQEFPVNSKSQHQATLCCFPGSLARSEVFGKMRLLKPEREAGIAGDGLTSFLTDVSVVYRDMSSGRQRG